MTIFNGRGLLEMPKLLANPTEETLKRYTIASEWALRSRFETFFHVFQRFFRRFVILFHVF